MTCRICESRHQLGVAVDAWLAPSADPPRGELTAAIVRAAVEHLAVLLYEHGDCARDGKL